MPPPEAAPAPAMATAPRLSIASEVVVEMTVKTVLQRSMVAD
jgi:hypothetical protein